MTALSFSGIEKSFGDRRVLAGLDFSVGRGEVYGLLGPNGSGKSTAINILCNLLDPDAGTVEIDGTADWRRARAAVGICPQEIALYRDLCPGENLRFFADLYGLSGAASTARIAELMQLFGLEPYAGTPVSALSGGWQRRVNIAVALVHSPALLVLDEPTAGLDVEARQELWQTIRLLRRQGMTILLTTHHLDEAEELCSRIAIMMAGQIVREGTLSELLALVPAEEIALIEAADAQAVLERAGALGWGIRSYGGRIGCLLTRRLTLEEVVQALSGVGVTSIALQRVSLEHAYLEVTRSGDAAA